MRQALAYLNYGRWVVDCPEPGCTDARLVYEVNPQTGEPTGRKLTEDVCAQGHPFTIVMPPRDLEAAIVTTVAERVEDADKAWYPKGHTRAALAGLPVGQSIDDLVAENAEVVRYRTALDDVRKERLSDLLAEVGIAINADGTFEGRI